MSTLEVRGLTVRRGGRYVVHGIDLALAPGEITALLGANGAGKSSTVLAIAGLLRDVAGTGTLGDRRLTGLTPHRIRRAGVATLQEGHRVFTDLSVGDNLRIAALLLPATRRRSAVAEMMELFPELAALADRRAGTLSGGQQQMLALATALAARPDFLVIDEMSLGLAPVVVARLVPALRAVAERGVGVLLIEQFTNVALQLATTATVLAQGRITLQASAIRLGEQPELLTQAYRLTGPTGQHEQHRKVHEDEAGMTT